MTIETQWMAYGHVETKHEKTAALMTQNNRDSIILTHTWHIKNHALDMFMLNNKR